MSLAASLLELKAEHDAGLISTEDLARLKTIEMRCAMEGTAAPPRSKKQSPAVRRRRGNRDVPSPGKGTPPRARVHRSGILAEFLAAEASPTHRGATSATGKPAAVAVPAPAVAGAAPSRRVYRSGILADFHAAPIAAAAVTAAPATVPTTKGASATVAPPATVPATVAAPATKAATVPATVLGGERETLDGASAARASPAAPAHAAMSFGGTDTPAKKRKRRRRKKKNKQ